jgi:hypothetical protein
MALTPVPTLPAVAHGAKAAGALGHADSPRFRRSRPSGIRISSEASDALR